MTKTPPSIQFMKDMGLEDIDMKMLDEDDFEFKDHSS